MTKEQVRIGPLVPVCDRAGNLGRSGVPGHRSGSTVVREPQDGLEPQLHCCCNSGKRYSESRLADRDWCYTVYCQGCGEETECFPTLPEARSAWIDDDDARYAALCPKDETEDSNASLGLTVGRVIP